MRALTRRAATIAIEDDKPQAIAAMRAAWPSAGDATDRPRGPGRDLSARRRAPADHGRDGARCRPADCPPRSASCARTSRTAAAVARWVARAAASADAASSPSPAAACDRPCNVSARIGTPLARLVAAAGGYRDIRRRLIAGGSMTGRALRPDAIGLTKGINCVLVATARRPARASPAHRTALHPLRRLCGGLSCGTAAAATASRRAGRRRGGPGTLGLWDCIECGRCDYVCPSQIPLTQRFRHRAQARLQRGGATARGGEPRATATSVTRAAARNRGPGGTARAFEARAAASAGRRHDRQAPRRSTEPPRALRCLAGAARIGGFTVPRVMFPVLLALVPRPSPRRAVRARAAVADRVVGVTALACEAAALRWRRRDARRRCATAACWSRRCCSRSRSRRCCRAG